VTLFMSLLAAFQALLWRYSGQDDIVVGTPIANRGARETEGLIGCFVNTLALRSRLESRLRWSDFLGRGRQTALGAYGHQDLPFEKLVEELEPDRDLSRSPLFQVMMILQNAQREDLRLGGLRLREMNKEVETAKFDLTMALMERDQGLEG